MRIELLSPLGGLLALGCLLPLAALVVVERRVRHLRAAIGLADPGVRSRATGLVAAVAVPGLLALAVAQPVIRYSGVHRVRTDVEIYYVFDVTRSMGASSSPGGTSRFRRAVDTAEAVHQRLADLPSGIATLTDRVLPSLLPTANDEVFTATAEALHLGMPPPRGYDKVGTLFAALDTFGSGTFFRPTTRYRVAVVFTDGESRPYDVGELRASLRAGPRVRFVIVRIWHEGDRVWADGRAVAGYRPDAHSAQAVADLGRATGGTVFSNSDSGAIAGAARKAAGRGPRVESGQILHIVSLGRWAALATLVPLGVLFWRRNLV